MKRIAGAFILVLALGSTTTASAFDGQREGFLLGFGIGAGMRDYEHGSNKTGLETDLKIGYSFTNQFQLFYTNKVNWRSAEGSSSGLIAHGLTGLGVNYYISPDAPSFFFGGGAGLASSYIISTDDNTNTNSHSGFGYYLGVGFEFARHVNIELCAVRDTIDFGSGNVSSLTYMLTLNALAF